MASSEKSDDPLEIQQEQFVEARLKAKSTRRKAKIQAAAEDSYERDQWLKAHLKSEIRAWREDLDAPGIIVGRKWRNDMKKDIAIAEAITDDL